jgi:predicted ATPase
MQAEQHFAPLHAAVADWLSYLGVAQSVRTADLGKIGHQLQVRTGDVSKDHDLTNVGVGVSQLLPIIVMALLAPAPSLLIFEQPELACTRFG